MELGLTSLALVSTWFQPLQHKFLFSTVSAKRSTSHGATAKSQYLRWSCGKQSVIFQCGVAEPKINISLGMKVKLT